ncbi:MAG: glutathionylspermidine synthase family protein [Catenulispora sp.]|nr:glutathionylspermidine synthase family protein [Catenulispora sp.]
MRRVDSRPRDDWQKAVESQGLVFPITTKDDGTVIPYWNESAHYVLTMAEVDALEETTEELHAMCLAAAEHIVARDRFADLGITDPAVVRAIRASWAQQPPTLYSRFDLRYDGDDGRGAKLLEYNADTPTMLLESAICQWYWLQDTRPELDQWNSLHERLVDAWQKMRVRLSHGPVHFVYAESDETGEDFMTSAYVAETAEQAGLTPIQLPIEQVGWHAASKWFVDLDQTRMRTVFKLYPWEWLVDEDFGPPALETFDRTQWIEPIWKMLLSNKALLAILWELYPEHPNLLPAYLDGPRGMTDYVAKPLLGREGASIQIVTGGERFEQPGEYGEEGYVYQAFSPLPSYPGRDGGGRAVLGSWLVAGEPAGLGIRESDGLITDTYARFVPHVIDG